MPRHYSPAEKIAACARLLVNRGNITLTAHQLGIPGRTLRDWRQNLLGKDQPPPSPPQSVLPPPPWSPLPPSSPPPTPPSAQTQAELPPFEDDLAAFNFMRRQMLDDLLAISLQLRQNFADATPYQRMVIIPQLLDRLMKLDERLKPYQAQNIEEDIQYIIVGAETFERDSDDGIVDFQLVKDGNETRISSPMTIKSMVRYEQQSGSDFLIRVDYWLPIGKNGNSNDYTRIWSGTLTLTNEESP